MSTPVKLRARAVAASLVERAPASEVRPLAMPPAGSGLKPVMGDSGPPIVGHTLEFLHKEKVPVAYFNILCPEKGTMFFEKMKADDRILRLEDIGRFPGEFCHIKPKNFSAEEIEKNVQDMYLKFYSWKSMLKRLPAPVTQSNIASWVVNISQRKLAQRSQGENNNNFDAY